MTDFTQQMQDANDLSEEDQKKAGTPIAGKMDDKHKKFLENLVRLIKSGEIDPYDQKSFLKIDIYESLSEEFKDKADLALINIADLTRLLYEFYESTETPDESPQLQTMVEQLWQMKEHIESHHDAFKI